MTEKSIGAPGDVGHARPRPAARAGSDPSADAPSREAVSEQLGRILSSPSFQASERRKRFLAFLVGEALAGRGDRLKGYGIAVAVFGRDDSFDPQTDPVVRLEARRLRRDLEHYYLTAGRDDPVRIDIPKGGYVPAFGRHGPGGGRMAAAGTAAAPAETSDPPARRLSLWRNAIGLILVLLLGLGTGAWVLLDRAGTPPAAPRQARGAEQGPALAVVPFETLV
jgi:hypothetical protein